MLRRRGGRAAIQLLTRNIASSSSSSKLFVGALKAMLMRNSSLMRQVFLTNETALKDAFSQHGDVIQVKVICHPRTGKSKGYGFVNFSSQDEAAAALRKMNGEVPLLVHGNCEGA
ncbi:hypothetical protein PR202_ga08153 [Eleusine coracana subsp. coracana]|uniref:RRM domain-containing protein n=1 Tax=Eleusine coracana subsp. coracana TaxID=191504 RepID=A0AAV5C1G3_ELECO|nr:hypothetical protein PR202_ga08153 [Eleusine coracana subsp. coracana]